MDATKRRFKHFSGRFKSSGRSSSPASTSTHCNLHSDTPQLLAKVSPHSLRTRVFEKIVTVSRSSENLSSSHSLSPTLAVQPSASPSLDQASTSSPPPAITISPAVPITEPALDTIATEETPESPAPPLNLWNKVFEGVNEETKKWIQTHHLISTEQSQPESQIKGLMTLLESKTLAEDKETPSSMVIGNHKIIFNEYLPGVVASLVTFGDIAMNFAPPSANAPWAAAKVLLKMPVKNIEQMAALTGTIQWFIRVVRRGQVYESIYTETNTDKQLLSDLHDALRDLYIAAMELLARSDELFKSRITTQMLNAILRPEQVSGLVSDLAKKEDTVMQEVQACEVSRSARTGTNLDQKLQDMLKILDEMSVPLRRMDEGIAKLIENGKQEQLEKLMNFISPEMFGQSHSDIKTRRIADTGNWLINHECFRNWQAIPSSTVLCLKGNVGTGKTFLTSRVIDHVKGTLETSAHDEGFAYFYCSRSGTSMQEPVVVLRSFVRQLCYRDDYEHVQKNIIQICQAADKEGRKLDHKECSELILDLLSLYLKTTIILDALDESDTEENGLAQTLVDLVAKAASPVKVFISSRPGREYLGAFDATPTITINSDDQQIDIGKFLDTKLYSTASFQRRQKEMQDLIRETFTTRNGGMFRWVHLQINRVNPLVSSDAVKLWAKTIPRGLMEAYDQMWDMLKKDHECDMPLIERAIKWVLCSMEPLSTNELLKVIRYTIEQDILVLKERQTPQEILLLCQDFLTIDAENQVWMVPHASVAEYFESRSEILGNCDAFASNIKLKVFMEFTEEVPVMEPNEHILFAKDEKYILDWPMFFNFMYRPFKQKFMSDWPEHVERYDRWLGSTKGATPDAQLVASLKRVLDPTDEGSTYYRRWFDLFQPGRIELYNAWIFMCRYGFFYVLQDWWESDIANNPFLQRITKRRYQALELAAEGGCMAICRRLLNTMDMKVSDRLRPAMKHAISRGNKDLISLIVTRGKFDTSLYLRDEPRLVMKAAHHPGLLQWLVNHRWFDASKGFSLHLAAMLGDFEAVRELIRVGVDVNRPPNVARTFGSALAAAVTQKEFGEVNLRRFKTINLLLEKGADPNLPLKTGRCGSALETVIVFYHPRRWSHDTTGNRFANAEEVLEILLKAGADPAMLLKHGDHGSALAAAACHGLRDMLVTMVGHIGKGKAIECLRQSRHPKEMYADDFEVWKQLRQGIITYLTDDIGVDKETLYKIGLWQVSPEEVGTFDGKYFTYGPSQKPNTQEQNIQKQSIQEQSIQEQSIQMQDTQEPSTRILFPLLYILAAIAFMALLYGIFEPRSWAAWAMPIVSNYPSPIGL